MLQTDGGYLGSDFEAFFSAVVSGAAGVYVGVLLHDAGIETCAELSTMMVKTRIDPGCVRHPG